MNRYQLAKIIEWAGLVDTRKRLQKVVYLLQTAGYPSEAEYALHHYGPYSHDVARLTDQMTQAELLEETSKPNIMGLGFRYSYSLSQTARSALADFEATSKGENLAKSLTPFEPKARLLFDADLRDLEYASTIVFFCRQGHEWDKAVEKMRVFKKLSKEDAAANRAAALAKNFV